VAPAGAVFRDGADAKPYVFVQAANGWVRRDVELGVASAIEVAIRSGLEAGGTIAYERPPDPSPGKV
jgi:hypothetical protein